MNIAMFTNAYAPIVGGVARSVETFAETLRTMGHQVLVVTVTVSGATQSSDHVFRLPAIKHIAGTQFSLKLPIPASLRDRLDAFNPDIIHSHHPFMLGDTALRVARRRGRPLLFTHHTRYEHYAYQFRHDSKVLENICKAVATEYANLCDAVIAPSPSIKQLIQKRGVTPPVDVIPTGVDIQRYAAGDRKASRKRRGIPAEAFVVGYLGRVAEVKNIEFLARAVMRFLQRCPTAWFLIAGDGDSVGTVKQILLDGGVANRSVITGDISGHTIADVYAAMDVFAFASKTDTQGIVLIEAFSAGIPVIALDAPGPRDTIEDGRTGRLLHADISENMFTQALFDIFRNEATRRGWSDAARERVKDYDAGKCAERLISCYQATQQNYRSRRDTPLDLFDSLQERFTAEWDLFREKIAVLTIAVTETSD